jgi:uncharacterized protein YdcH (DUF465 family)
MKNVARGFDASLASLASLDLHSRLGTRVSAQELAEHARDIEHQIKKLDRRGAHITPTEEARAHQLKRLRLVVKDRLASLQPN